MPKDEAKPQPMTEKRLAEIREINGALAKCGRRMWGPGLSPFGDPTDVAADVIDDLLAEVDRLRALADDDTSLLDWASTNYAKHDGMISEAVEEGWQLRDALRGARDGTLADDLYGDDDDED